MGNQSKLHKGYLESERVDFEKDCLKHRIFPRKERDTPSSTKATRCLHAYGKFSTSNRTTGWNQDTRFLRTKGQESEAEKRVR